MLIVASPGKCGRFGVNAMVEVVQRGEEFEALGQPQSAQSVSRSLFHLCPDVSAATRVTHRF